MIKTLSGHTEMINSLKLIQMDLLVSASDDNSIIFWNLTTNSTMNQLWLHTDWVSGLETFNGSIFFK